MIRRRGALLCASLTMLLGLCACSRRDKILQEDRANSLKPIAEQTLNVYAASSMREVLTDVARQFEEERAGVSINLTFAGSQVLRLQIEHGAPAEIFVSANAEHVAALGKLSLAVETRGFAASALALIVPKENPAAVNNFESVIHAKRIVLGVAEVPVGRYTQQLLNKADVRYGAGFSKQLLARVASRESNARLVRAKVELGAADAAVVYRTDALASLHVKQVPIPEPLNVSVKYYAAKLSKRGSRSSLAGAFFDYLCSEKTAERLEQHGFLPLPC